MKKSRHIEEKIIAAVKQMDGGRKTGDAAREMGVSAATLYAWKSKYGGRSVHRLDEPAELSLGMVASQHNQLPFRPATSL